MIELFQNLDWVEIGNHNLTTIVLFGLVGTVLGYWGRWAWSENDDVKLGSYMFGNGKAVSRALLVFGASVVGIYAAGIPANMDFSAAAYTGLGLGLAVPNKVDSKEEQLIKEEAEKLRQAKEKYIQNTNRV